jgi:ubiquinone/menaquinone biosynthesis C-methylase UbiE
MLAIASQRYCHPRITYRQIRDNRLDFLADGSMDAAMSCFVFIVLPAREQLRAIAAEVWRVLRPGGRFVVLDPHPDHLGIQFSTGPSNRHAHR